MVFFADTESGPVAVRCLKEPIPGGAKRYSAVSAYLMKNPVAAIPQAEWIEDGISVARTRWPIVTMELVSGSSLLNFVKDNLHDPLQLTQAAADWRALISELSRVGIAHGDLQHDNVMLADGRRLRLVDLDGMWIPTLDGRSAPTERGHKNFQHPERTRRGSWGRHMDTFPALVIYISLLAVAADPGLFAEFNSDHKLIFSHEDFVEPGKTPLWPRLWASPDLNLRNLVTVLERCCRTTAEVDADLDTLLSGAGAAGPKLAKTTPWWTLAQAETAGLVIGRPIEQESTTHGQPKPEPAREPMPLPVSVVPEEPTRTVPEQVEQAGERSPGLRPAALVIAILAVILILVVALALA